MNFTNQSISVSSVPGEFFYIYENVLCPFNHLSALSRMFAETSEVASADSYDSAGHSSNPVLSLVGPALQELNETHAGFDVCIPAPFFFCENISAAIPICAFPTTRKEVRVELNDLEHVTVKGFGLSGTSGSTLAATASVWGTAPTVKSIDLWVNHVFLPSWLTDIISERVSFFLIRNVAMAQTETTQAIGEFEPGVNYPIEYMFIGFCPTVHVTGVPIDSSKHTDSDIFANYKAGKDYFNWTTDEGNYMINSLSLHVGETYFFKEVPPMMTNSYFFLKYGGDRINSPPKKDIHFFNFAAFPGQYQPSGTLNCGRVAGLRLAWSSSFIGSNTTTSSLTSVTVFMVIFYLNFFLVVDGGASLKYTA